MNIFKHLRRFYSIYRNFCKKRRITHYLRHGRKPWSKGYSDFKWQLIEKNINSSNLLNRFKNNLELPQFYGKNIDERIIEYPWLMSNLPEKSGDLLDAGSSLNHEQILNHQKLSNKKITIVNLTPEDRCFWQKASYIFVDLRQLAFLDNSFDIVVCISTLEHIGMDNTMIYTKNKKYEESKKEDYLRVVSELKRILKPEGVLFITVPFGKYQDFRFFQQFNQNMINQIIKVFKGKGVLINYYKYSERGWDVSNAEECKNIEYFDIWQTRYKDKNSSKDYDPDFAAAARAIACLKLVK